MLPKANGTWWPLGGGHMEGCVFVSHGSGDMSSQEDRQMDQSLILESQFEEGGGDAMNLDDDDAVVVLPITDTFIQFRRLGTDLGCLL